MNKLTYRTINDNNSLCFNMNKIDNKFDNLLKRLMNTMTLLKFRFVQFIFI